MKDIDLKQLLYNVHLLHLIQMETSEGGPKPLIAHYDFRGKVELGWDLTIYDNDILPLVIPLLKQLGFKLSADGFYSVCAAPGKSRCDIDADVAWELIPARLIRRGNIDAEMVDILLRLKSGDLPIDLCS
jgi:hypothetical protein